MTKVDEWLVESKMRVRRIIDALAQEPIGQLRYLQSLGFQAGREVVDELALELDEVPQRLDGLVAAGLLSRDTADHIRLFCEEVTDQQGIWDRDELNAPAWGQIRSAAAELLREID